MTDTVLEVANNSDPYMDKLEATEARLRNIEDLLEEVLEKLSDLQSEGFGTGYSVVD